MPRYAMPNGDPVLTPTSTGEWYEYSGSDLESVRGWKEFEALMLSHQWDAEERYGLSDVLVGHEQWVMIAKSRPLDVYGITGNPATIMGVPIIKVVQANCLIFRHRRR